MGKVVDLNERRRRGCDGCGWTPPDVRLEFPDGMSEEAQRGFRAHFDCPVCGRNHFVARWDGAPAPRDR